MKKFNQVYPETFLISNKESSGIDCELLFTRLENSVNNRAQ